MCMGGCGGSKKATIGRSGRTSTAKPYTPSKAMGSRPATVKSYSAGTSKPYIKFGGRK